MARNRFGLKKKEAWDRDLGPCGTCKAGFREPCRNETGYVCSPHTGRTTDPAYVVLHQAAR